MTILVRPLLAIISILVAAGCGGGGNSSGASSPPPPVKNQAVGGIWRGQATTNGVTANGVGLVAEDGRFYMFAQNQSNGCAAVAVGTLASSGSTLSGNAKFAIVEYAFSSGITTGCTYPDGTTWGTSTISGTVAERSTLSITETGKTSAGTALPTTTYQANFDALYNSGSSLTTVAGNWMGPTGLVMNINSNGVIFVQDPASGCVVNGQVSIINAAYNAYDVSATYSSCLGGAAVLNGVTATGLAAVNDTASPNLLYIGYSVVLSSGQTVIVASEGTR